MKKILVVFCVLLITSIRMFAEQKVKDSVIQKEVVIVKNDKSDLNDDSLLMEKLSSEQIMELKKQQIELEKQKIEARSKNDMPLKAFHIVLIVMTPFLFVIILASVAFYIRNRDSERRYMLFQKSLELGQTLPEHFFEEPKKQNTSSNLKKGVIAMAIGLALVVSFFVIDNKFMLIAGVIPAFVGLGFLLVHYLEKPKDNNNEQNG